MYASTAATERDEASVLSETEVPDDACLLSPQPSLVHDGGIVNQISRRLFISHFLSTWNSRFFEFGAVLFLVTIFPDSLMPPSVYALARAAAAIFLAPSVGRYVDSGARIHVVRVSIIGQRAAVAASCLVFGVMMLYMPTSPLGKVLLFGVLVLCSAVEKLCSIMNLVAIERDWVVAIAGSNNRDLQALNSQMRRIDLFCKLVGPLTVAFIDGVSTLVAIWVVLGLNLTSVLIEYFAIAQVYNIVPALQEPRQCSSPSEPPSPLHGVPSSSSTLFSWIRPLKQSLTLYFRHPVFLPSFALALLYFTVLSFSGQMVAYLLTIGYTSTHVGLIRTVSVMFEISATWLAPWAMNRIGPVRAGLWFINWQLACLASAVAIFWATRELPFLSGAGLVAGVITSRIGLWGFDLCVQLIVQDEVNSDSRGSFSAVEASFQNIFEAASYASTVVFSKPELFRWPVTMSAGAVFVAAALYAEFVRERRGHLVHDLRYLWEKACEKSDRTREDGLEEGEHLLADDSS